MDKNAKIFVAGHSGLVGSAIKRTLERQGFSNILTVEQSRLDLRNQQSVQSFFQSERPEYVFLAAAKVGGILANNTYKAEFIYDNLAIATNVIDASYRVGVRKLLNLGSSCIYPKHAPQPLREDMLLGGPLEPTNEPYAVAKIAAIKLCRYYNEQYGTEFLSVMPTNLYGPGDNFNLETSHVLPALMRKFHLARLLKEGRLNDVRVDVKKRSVGFGHQSLGDAGDQELEQRLAEIGVASSAVRVWGTGMVKREFLFSDDLAAAVVHLMMHCTFKDVGEFVNIGTGSDVTIKELASRIRAVVGFLGEIQFDTSKPDGTPQKLLDVSRIQALGWRAATTLEDGLNRLYTWYCGQ